MIKPNGDLYEGKWLNNLKHGFGLFKTNNCSYEGEFKFDKMNGEGIYIIDDLY